MKKEFLSTILLVFFSSIAVTSLIGQPVIKDPSEAYDYWSKRGIIEVVYAYMNDYIITVTDSTLPKYKIKDCKNEKNGLKKFEQQFIEKINDKSIENINSYINDLSHFLKNNNWGGTDKNLLQPLLENQKNSKPLNSEFFITYKPTSNDKSTFIPGYNNELIKFNETLIRIVNEYNISIKGINPSKLTTINIIPSSVTLEPRKSCLFSAKGFDQFNKEIKIDFLEWETDCGSINDDGQLTAGKSEGDFSVTASSNGISATATVTIKEEKSSTWMIILFCIVSFFIGCLFVFFLSRLKIFLIIGEDRGKYLAEVQESSNYSIIDYFAIVELLKKRKDIHKKKVEELEIIIKNLNKIEPKIETIKQGQQSNQQQEEKQDEPIGEEEKSKVVEWDILKGSKIKPCLFFSIPESDGRFIIEKGDSVNDGMKFYRIDYKNNSDQGELLFISSDQDKRAINRLDSYLKPVCDIDNIVNSETADKILLIKPGKVIQIGDSWVIDSDNKVKIKLI
jgi:hypothetical protein